MTLDEALETARSQGHFHAWPATALRRLHRTRQDGLWLSPSSANRCHRRRLLELEHDYYLPLDKQWAAAVGTAIHGWLEDAKNPNHEIKLEMMLHVPLEDGTIVDLPMKGTSDFYDPKAGLAMDYKSVSDFWKFNPETKKRQRRRFPEEDHILQANLYRLMLESSGRRCKRFLIWYVKTDKTAQREMVEVPLWDLDETYYLACELARPLAQALHSGRLPDAIPVDSEAAWVCRFCPVQGICRQLEAEGT